MSTDPTFNPLLVACSVLVAIFASYVALNLAQSVTGSQGKAKLLWLISGALAMGVGIWSMHFVGMLAFEMPGMVIAYGVKLLILSIVVAIAGSAIALAIISQAAVPMSALLSGGVAMAAAISGMHYIGMYSMSMPATIHWNIYLVLASIGIALVASYGALGILIRYRNKPEKIWQLLAASIVMGFAISGMHYTGMLAATFIHDGGIASQGSKIIVSHGLSIAVLATTLFILGLALATSVGQRILARKKKNVDQILVKGEETFRHLVEAVKDYAIFMLDPAGHITTWNSGAERIIGYNENEVRGKHVSIFYPTNGVSTGTFSAEKDTALETGHFEAEVRRMRKDGTIFWANIVLVPLYNKEGELIGFSKVIRDVTHIKEFESRMLQLNEQLEQRVKERTRALEDREHQLRTITNAVPVLLAQIDRNERILFANEAFCNWFGSKPHGIVGENFSSILGPDRYPGNRPFVERALRGETTTYERLSRSGSRFASLAITLVPEFDENQNVSRIVILASDITKHKEIEDELKRAKEAAEVANEAKSAFLANMSHEIRTPLGAILGFSELMLNEKTPPAEKEKCVEVINRNGRVLSTIINDILDLSKVEAGKLQIEKVNVAFGDVIHDIGSILNLEATAKGIDLRITADGAIPSHINTDPLRLRQILLNIIGNAIKFTAKGSVDVRVKMVTGPNDESKLAFIVKDTGEGIAPEHAVKLFTPFTQADISTTRKFGGTGLGLALAKKLAKLLGGDVELKESVPGKGSTFVITIDPGLYEHVIFQSHQLLSPAPMPAMPPPLTQPENLNKLNILLVEDSLDNQMLIKRILNYAGASVTTANNGKEGVDQAFAPKAKFHVILMDLQMPVMDGYEATKILRNGGYDKPIIALTAHAMKDERERALASGFDDHITKPVNQKMLIHTLAKYAHRPRPSRPRPPIAKGSKSRQ
jgi:PAS domain S-box-containing protein